jgi:hypothetical protein
MDSIVARIEFAFAHVPRPANDELLDPERRDDGDVVALYPFDAWEALPDETIEREHAALALLSPAGFRHFLPAYMRWVARHGEEQPGAAVVGATFQALTPQEGVLAPVSMSKFSQLGAEQSSCIAAVLDRMVHHADARDARAYWRMRAGYLPSASESREA